MASWSAPPRSAAPAGGGGTPHTSASYSYVPASYAPAGGARLAAFLDGLPIRTRWLAGHPVVWQSGQQNGPDGALPPDHTHAAAFTAAVALMLDIHVLRPPWHGQLHLPEAQTRWLCGSTVYGGLTAAAAGWVPVGRSGEPGALAAAMRAADAGRLVLACHAPPRTGAPPSRGAPGHVAIVRPAGQGDRVAGDRVAGDRVAGNDVPDDGPDVIMAGARNFLHVSLREAFAAFPGAWPDAIALFSHETVLQQDVAG